VLPRVFKPSIYRDYRFCLHLVRISPDFCGTSVIEKLTRFGYDLRVSYARVRHDHRQGRASLHCCIVHNFDGECFSRRFEPSMCHDYRVYSHNACISPDFCRMIVTAKLTRSRYDLRVNYVRVRHDQRQGRVNLHYCIVTSLLRYRVRLLELRIFDSECSLRVFKPSIYHDYRLSVHYARVSSDFCGMSMIEKLARFGNDIHVSYVRVRRDHRQGRASLHCCIVHNFDSECSRRLKLPICHYYSHARRISAE